MRILCSVLGVSAVVVMAACSADPTSAELEPAELPETATKNLDTEFTLTVVDTKDDGTVSVQQRPITLRQEIADREYDEKKAAAAAKGITLLDTRNLALDPSCSQLQMWDATNYTGNKICFLHPGSAGVADLSQYVRTGGACPSNWFGYSYYQGPTGGCRLLASSQYNWVKSFKSTLRGAFTVNPSGCQGQCGPPWLENTQATSVSGGSCRYVYVGYTQLC